MQLTGSVRSTATGGKPPYTFNLVGVPNSNRTSTYSIVYSELPAGNYTVSVSDTVGCYEESGMLNTILYVIIIYYIIK